MRERFHVLCILRDADVTRPLDRLERQGWGVRSRGARDRRVVTARITREGGRWLEVLEEPVAAHHEQPQRPGTEELGALRRLLQPHVIPGRSDARAAV